eukprot:7725352-Pyramimonas_sp.AAC.1
MQTSVARWPPDPSCSHRHAALGLHMHTVELSVRTSPTDSYYHQAIWSLESSNSPADVNPRTVRVAPRGIPTRTIPRPGSVPGIGPSADDERWM